MTTVSVAGYVDVASTSNSLTRAFALPAGIQSGSTALVIVGWGNGSAVTASLPGWTLLDGPYNVNNSANWSLFSKSVGAADSSTSHTVTFSSSSPSSVQGIVGLASIDAQSSHTADTSTVTTSTVAGITPSAADCLLVSLVGGYHSSGVTAGGTAPSGWNRHASASSTPTTQTQMENALDTKQLVGQAGSAQSSTTIGWTGLTRTAKWVVTLAPITPPTASFTYSPSALTISVDGTGSSAVSPATISSYDWDWGDSTTHGSGSTASHTYSIGGTYTVILTVTDSSGHTNTSSQSITVAPAAGTVTAQSVDVSTGWTASSGTALSCITDGNPATFVTSSSAPTALEFDFTLAAATPPSSGQPFKVFLTMDAPLASSASLAAQLGETISGSFTQRSPLTGVTIAVGSGGSVTNVVTLTFPWSDVQNMTTNGWNAPRVKLQVTAS